MRTLETTKNPESVDVWTKTTNASIPKLAAATLAFKCGI